LITGRKEEEVGVMRGSTWCLYLLGFAPVKTKECLVIGIDGTTNDACVCVIVGNEA